MLFIFFTFNYLTGLKISVPGLVHLTLLTFKPTEQATWPILPRPWVCSPEKINKVAYSVGLLTQICELKTPTDSDLNPF